MRVAARCALATSLASALLLAGCSGGQSGSSLPGAATPVPAPTGDSAGGNTTFRVTVPKAASNGAKYISPATQSITLVVTPSGSAQSVYAATNNLLPTSPGCGSTVNGTVCTIVIDLAPGAYVATAETYAGQNATGAVLSQAMQVPFSVGNSNSNLVPLTLSGVPHAIEIEPVSTAVTGTEAAGFTVTGPGVGQAQGFTIVALDAANNAIVGAGSPTFTLSYTTSHGVYTITQPTTAAPNQFAIAAPSIISGYAKVTAKAAYADSTCSQKGAVCSVTFVFNYSPFDRDDWITFAHDFARTGLQTQPTGITPATLPGIQVRWKKSVTGFLDGVPLAWKGNVIVVNNSGMVYDLSAADGSVLWSKSVGGQVVGTPSIDTTDGIVFVMNRIFSGSLSEPSVLYALDIANGNVVWQATLPGPMRSSPVYANGVVYQGWAGGDHPQCINGGIEAINAKTGTTNWTFLTNPGTNPGGGGGVWGGIAFDGRVLYFGTGNVCAADIPGQQGVIAVNLDGTRRWAFTAETAVNKDDDTGGAVMLRTTGNGIATALNKDGTLYTFDLLSGTKLSGTPLGAADSYGGFATPTSDGSIVVVGAGMFPVSAANAATRDDATATGENWIDRASSQALRRPSAVIPGYSSYLKAVDASGNIIWSVPMTARQDNYAAIYDGMVFAGIDEDIEVLDIHSGKVLWTYPQSSYFVAPPTIVPSGMYASDQAGEVFAFYVKEPTVVQIQSKPQRSTIPRT